MKSMVTYLEWLATDKNPDIEWTEVKGVKTPKFTLLDRAAAPVQGTLAKAKQHITCFENFPEATCEMK